MAHYFKSLIYDEQLMNDDIFKEISKVAGFNVALILQVLSLQFFNVRL
jgi:hypothetical protein